MFVSSGIKVGVMVRIVKPVATISGTFTKGHCFIVETVSANGNTATLRDSDNRALYGVSAKNIEIIHDLSSH